MYAHYLIKSCSLPYNFNTYFDYTVHLPASRNMNGLGLDPSLPSSLKLNLDGLWRLWHLTKTTTVKKAQRLITRVQYYLWDGGEGGDGSSQS